MRYATVRSHLTWLAVCGAMLIPVCRSGAQLERPTLVVAQDASVDLWFHTLAVLGVNGPGTLPFYDAAYARQAAGDRARRGVSAPLLERRAPGLRQAIMADSAFEVLHFLPLYLDRTSPEAVAPFLRGAASTTPVALEPRSVVDALRNALPSRIERSTLTALADVVSDEWTGYVRDRTRRNRSLVAARRRALQAVWNEKFAARLAPVTQALGDPQIVVLVSPPLGAEGRVVRVGTSGMIIAVSDWPEAGAPDAPLLAAIRELCFPLLQRVTELDPAMIGHAPHGAEASSRAAVRCGAQLIDSLVPASASEYRALFLSPLAGESPDGYRRRFDRRFTTDADVLRAVARTVAKYSETSP